MPSHRFQNRRTGVRPTPTTDGPTDTTVARGVSVEESFVPDVDELPKPAGFGTETSTSTQSFEQVDEYTVPAGTLAEVQEASLSIEGNGEALVSVGGVRYGPYTGATDVEVPLEGSRLTAGYQVRVHHQSTDGNSTTTQAQLVVLEV